MRTPGPVDPSLRIVDAGAGRGPGREAGLKAGALVSLVVRERIGSELYRVSIGRELLTASSSTPLEIGSLLKARVEGSGLLLRVLASREGPSSTQGGSSAGKRTNAGDATSAAFRAAAAGSAAARAAGAESAAARAASVLSAAGLPSDAAARSALAALLREGMAPEARALSRVRRAALREGEGSGEATELAARMEAKGMSAEDAALSEILSFMDGRGRGGRGKGEYRGGAGGGDEPGFPPAEPPSSGAIDPDKDFRAELSEAELPRFLAGLLRAMASRPGGGCDSLSLFNHLRGPEGSWVIVPFRIDLDAVDFAGSFRIQLPYVRGGQGRFEAFFSASRGPSAEDWSFFISFGGGRPPSLRIEAPRGTAAESLARSRLGGLAAELAAHACSVRMGEGERERGGGLDLHA
jgi:hypothetical protein